MDAAWLVLLLPLAATSGWLFAVYRGHHRDRQPQDDNQSYLFGINQLLEIDDDEALKSFLETMGDQPKSVELQMVLGSLCRRKGEYERASLIHQTILSNSTHTVDTRQQAQFELAQDYQSAGWLDRSESLYLELLNSSRFKYDTATSLLRIYQHEKDWESAVQMANLLKKMDPDAQSLGEQLAHFYCEICESCIRDGRFPDAERYLQNALQIEPANPRVIILSGRIAIFKGEHRTALQAWKKLELVAPAFLGLAMPNIQDTYQLLNDSVGYLEFLKRAARATQVPEVLSALLLALKAENPGGAQQFLVQYLKDQPNIDGLKQILKSWKDVPGQISHDELLFLLETLMSLVQSENRYQCGECGFKAASFEWSCPGCHTWGSYKRHTLKLPEQSLIVDAGSDEDSLVTQAASTRQPGQSLQGR